MRIKSFVAAIAVLPLLIGACGSDSGDSTVAATETAASETTVEAPAESVAAETVPTETVAADTTAVAESAPAATDTTASAATDTTASAAGSEAALGDTVILTEILKGMNGGKEPSAADVECLAKEFPPDKLAKFTAAATSGGSADVNAMAPLLTAVFKCKPTGLAESLALSLNDDGSLDGLSATESTCLADGILDLFSEEESLMQEFVKSGGTTSLSAAAKAELTKKATPAVNRCVKDEALRKKVIASMTK